MGYSPRGHKESDMTKPLHFTSLLLYHTQAIVRFWKGWLPSVPVALRQDSYLQKKAQIWHRKKKSAKFKSSLDRDVNISIVISRLTREETFLNVLLCISGKQ